MYWGNWPFLSRLYQITRYQCVVVCVFLSLQLHQQNLMKGFIFTVFSEGLISVTFTYISLGSVFYSVLSNFRYCTQSCYEEMALYFIFFSICVFSSSQTTSDLTPDVLSTHSHAHHAPWFPSYLRCYSTCRCFGEGSHLHPENSVQFLVHLKILP